MEMGLWRSLLMEMGEKLVRFLDGGSPAAVPGEPPSD
jgi:hypothetical protein